VDALPPERRVWLETLATACSGVLAREDGDGADWAYAELRQDVEELLGRITAELDDAP
jgi:hypothetical protein